MTSKETTGSYEEWLINALKDKEEWVAFLTVALEEFKKDGDTDAFVLSLKHYLKANEKEPKDAKLPQ